MHPAIFNGVLRLWKEGPGRLAGRSPHGPGAAFALGIFAAQLALFPATAAALAVETAGHSFLLGVLAHLRRIDGVVVIIAARGDSLSIFTAELALLTTTALARFRDTALGILLPSALQALRAVEPIAGILVLELLLSILAHLWRIHRVPVILAAGVDALGVFAAQLALLATAAAAGGLDAALGIFLPGLTISDLSKSVPYLLR